MSNYLGRSFYKAHMGFDDRGIAISFAEYICIQESPCICFCVDKEELNRLNLSAKRSELSVRQVAKKLGIKIHHIHKGVSRVAFETHEQAYRHLLFLKRKQLWHITSTMAVVKLFLDKSEASDLLALKEDRWGVRYVPDTEDTIRQYYKFD